MNPTDAKGVATLKSFPGPTDVIVEPFFGHPYLPKRIPVALSNNETEQSLAVKLDSAAEVVFEAVDRETGAPIKGIAFLSESAERRDRAQVQSQLSFVDYPRTDSKGQLRAFFEPGKRLFFVDQRRSEAEFEPVASVSEPVDLSSGEITSSIRIRPQAG